MVNFYSNLKANPHYFKQITWKELLFLNYDCPVKEKVYDMWSEYSYFIYVISGKKVWYSRHNSWTLTAGCAIYVKPGACIVEQFFEEPFCVMVFFVPDSYLKKFLHANDVLLPQARPAQLSDLVIPVKVDEVMKAFYYSVLPYFEMEKQPPEQLIELKFQELLLNILSNPGNTELISYMHSLFQSANPSLQQIMEQNFSYNLQMEEFARLCNRSLSSFKRDFNTVFGTTPGRWLTEKRLQYAHKLLSTTQMNIGEISFESGFVSSTHFSRIFKQKYGLSPQRCRIQVKRIPM